MAGIAPFQRFPCPHRCAASRYGPAIGRTVRDATTTLLVQCAGGFVGNCSAAGLGFETGRRPALLVAACCWTKRAAGIQSPAPTHSTRVKDDVPCPLLLLELLRHGWCLMHCR